MNVSRMAGCCLILLGIINVLHEVVLRTTGRGQPGLRYAIVSAALFAVGTGLFLRPQTNRKQNN